MPAMNSKYHNVVAVPRDKAQTPKQEVKAKFKEILAKNNKKQCNYEEVHALYKTEKKVRPKTPTDKQSDEQQALQKKPQVPHFIRDNFFISRPAVPMIEQFYEKYIKDDAIIQKGILEGKFV